jgi:iron complex outermembrane recepter protein
MTWIRGFRGFDNIFRSGHKVALQSGFCRLYSRKTQKAISHPHKDPKQNISASPRHLKPFDFRSLCLSGFIICLAFMCPNPAFSANEKSLVDEDEIFEMDIRQLMQTEVIVTSVSKRPEQLHKAASAIYVLTQEDIRRSGAVNIMEALRMVPGVLVSKLNQNRYAISIRGFNQRLGSDKLLVLMDGRSIYSPVQSGVFWIGQDTVLEDIERIEVIRGPGAALWGSNAVAGVINIITKSAGKTQGGLVAGGIGTEENGFGTVRYGGKLKNGLNYRVYGKYRNRDSGVDANGNDSFDSKQMGQGGFRTDWQINKQDLLTMQGDYYRLNSDLDFTSRFISLSAGSAPFQGTNVQEGANFLTRLQHTFDDASSYQLQVYYDRLKRKSGVPFDNVVDQLDIDFQHNFSFANVHNFSWGLNYRYTYFDLETTNIIQNNKDDSHLASLFLHDEIELIPEELSLILGVKTEYNVFTGLEIQPNARVAWNPHQNHTIWAAFSRAVRLPTVTDENVMINRALIPAPGIFGTGNPTLIQQVPNTGTKAEVLLAYELGYRVKASEKLSFDVTAYYFDYDNLLRFNNRAPSFFLPGPPAPTGFHDVLPVTNDNSVKGEIYGVELSGQWQVFRNWRLSGSYTFADIQLHAFPGAPIDPGAFNSAGKFEAELEPSHIFNIRSYLNLPHNLEFDTFYYYVSSRSTPTPQFTFQSIPEYGRLDVRLGWKPMKNVDLSFVAQNLLDPSHPELRELVEVSSETQRSYYIKATLKF